MGGPNDLPDAVKAAKKHVQEVTDEIKAGGSGKTAEKDFKSGKTAEGISQEETPPSNLDQFLDEPQVIHIPDEATGLDKGLDAGAGGKGTGTKKPEDKGKDHKYDVLKGKYDTEIPALNEKLKSLELRLNQRDQLIHDQQLLIQKISEAGASAGGDGGSGGAGSEDDIKPGAKKIDLSKLGDYDEVFQEVASNLNDVIDANTALREENIKLIAEIKNLRTQTDEATETVAKHTSNTFWGRVTEAIPKWYEYNGDANGKNADPRWANFLNGFDPSDMVQYRTKAAEAINGGDYTSMIKIIKVFEKLIGNVTAGGDGGAGAGGGAGGAGSGSNDDELEALVSHKKSGAGGAGEAGKTPVVTEEDMAKARSLLTAGKIDTVKFRKILDAYHKTMMGQG